MNFKRFMAVFNARNKEFVRDRSALIWNFIFPVIVVFGFAYSFSGNNQNVFKVSLHETRPGAHVAFQDEKFIQFIPGEDLPSQLEKLKRHQYDMSISVGDDPQRPAQVRYWVNLSSPKGYLLERILWSTSQDRSLFKREAVDGAEIRYVDWLIAGLIGMNMMFSALFGVGYTIVRYRKTGVLKRLKATPLDAFTFLLAQVFSRLMLIIATSLIVYFGCNAFIHFRMIGSYFNLFVILLAGAMCLISLGLLVAARIASEEFAGGVLNMISWPMMFLSGVWFSLEGANAWVKKAALVFPLTHVIDAARAVMTEGASLGAIAPNLLALGGMTLLFLIVGSLSFKWE